MGKATTKEVHTKLKTTPTSSKYLCVIEQLQAPCFASCQIYHRQGVEQFFELSGSQKIMEQSGRMWVTE
jgi:hypothetical protein